MTKTFLISVRQMAMWLSDISKAPDALAEWVDIVLADPNGASVVMVSPQSPSPRGRWDWT
jgi:hypothetical protein